MHGQVNAGHRERLGEILVAMGAVTADRVEAAVAEQHRRTNVPVSMAGSRGGRLATALPGRPASRLGRLLDIDETTLSRALARQFGLRWQPGLPALDPGLRGFVPRDLIAAGAALPIERTSTKLTVALADPSDSAVLERVAVHTGLSVTAVVVPSSALQAAARSYSAGESTWAASADTTAEIPADADRLESGAELEAITEESLSDERFPVARLVNGLLFSAVREGASDIHIEPRADGVRVKFRLDGVLVSRLSGLRPGLLAPVVSRIKVLARLDVAETRVPQDGRFRVWVAGREVDFRVAILPTILGESAVLRILDRRSTLLSLSTLGFEATELSRFRSQIRAPYGMVLVSGPTGSGKTTTLYAAIRDVYREEDKWITIEEPIEYQLDGVMQIPVNPRKGVTFAQGLRAIVRQDPDRLMVGEIRDRETAEIAINAAMTGHLVLSTIHANNVVDTLGRLRHLGIEPYQIVSAFNVVMAQRLIRQLCGACKQAVVLDDETLAGLDLTREQAGCASHWVSVGCAECGGAGYRGRRPIFEMLTMNDEIRELLLERASLLRVRQCARQHGMKELRERALELVRTGETSLEETLRVTREA